MHGEVEIQHQGFLVQVLKSYQSNTTVLLIVQIYINVGPIFMYICTINKTVVLE